MIALLTNLQTKGLPSQTLVVLRTEFGRTPRINDNDGWDSLARIPAFWGLLKPLAMQTSRPRGCWGRRWWSKAPSSAALPASTTRAGRGRDRGGTPAATTSRGTPLQAVVKAKGLLGQRWWSWPPSSDVRRGCTATTGGSITTERSRACWPGREAGLG